MRAAVVGLAVLALAGCVQPPPPAPVNDGYARFPRSGTFDCGNQPVAVDTSHSDLELQGSCPRLRATGSHNDITVYVPPNAVIEVTGSSNTIVYRLIRAGAKPQWIDSGQNNELIRNSVLSSQQDHDWYQEHH